MKKCLTLSIPNHGSVCGWGAATWAKTTLIAMKNPASWLTSSASALTSMSTYCAAGQISRLPLLLADRRTRIVSLVARPSQGCPHRALPSGYQSAGGFFLHRGVEAGELPGADEFGRVAPHATADSGQARRTECGRLDHVGSLDGNSKHVGLELQQPVIRRGAAIHAERLELYPAALGHRGEHLCRAVRHRL